MHVLPPVCGRDQVLPLPLVAATATAIADALLTDDSARRRTLLRDALAADPALVIWALANAPHACGRQYTSLDSLAHLLAENPLEMFGRAAPARKQSLGGYADAAGQALAVAQLARLLAADTGADSQQAYLLGLLHTADAWLAPADGGDAPTALPQWLTASLSRLHRRAALASQEERCVAQAIALVPSTDPDAWQTLGLNAQEWIDRWRRLGQSWATEGPQVERLAAIVEMQSRLAKLETRFAQTLETAKLEAIKEFAYGAGHEINNPLANISARAQTLLASETDPERRRTLAAINAQAFRAHEMIADMMLFARPPEPVYGEVELVGLLRELHAELQVLADEQSSLIDLELPAEELSIEADRTQLAVAVRSLCVNSLEALVTGGQVRIELLPPTANDPRVAIRVADDGPGIPPEVRPKIFEPYYSGREAGRGLGLGLSKCWRIVTQHGGAIDVAGGEPSGASFTLWLPPTRPR